MSFADISALGGVSYIEQTRSADAVWGFSHIPKTAGSSLIASLEAHRAPYYNIHVRNYATGRAGFREQEWEAVREFADIQKLAPADTRFRSFSGHMRRPHIDFIQTELPGTRFFTLLREPVARVVSDYRYCLSPSHPTHEQFAAQFPTITDFIRHPKGQNVMSKRLAAKWDTAEMVLDSVLHGFEFIGIMELYDVSLSMIFRLMGLTHIPTRRVNETISTDRNAIELSDAVREEIVARNAIDDALYRAVREILEPQCEAWRRHFATLSPPDIAPAR
jgi:Sulfotransferase family